MCKAKEGSTRFIYYVLSKIIKYLGVVYMESDRPLDALNNARGKKIMVELKNGKQLIGKLKAFDIHINVVLEDVEERVDGQIKRKIGTAFIRGDTIILITPE
jgi:small nuclear ribonucleoprotein